MGHKCYFMCCFLCVSALFGQKEVASDSLENNYREDQFYFGITYNILLDTPQIPIKPTRTGAKTIPKNINSKKNSNGASTKFI